MTRDGRDHLAVKVAEIAEEQERLRQEITDERWQSVFASIAAANDHLKAIYGRLERLEQHLPRGG